MIQVGYQILDNGVLHITAEGDDLDEVRDLVRREQAGEIDYWRTLGDIFESLTTNGWDWIRPEDIGALVDEYTPIISDDVTRDDDYKYIYAPRAWTRDGHQLIGCSIQEILAEIGEVNLFPLDMTYTGGTADIDAAIVEDTDTIMTAALASEDRIEAASIAACACAAKWDGVLSAQYDLDDYKRDWKLIAVAFYARDAAMKMARVFTRG